MSNRSYLFSLGNRPTSFADRPETVRGLTEWAYLVPFSVRVLMSGDPQLSASLLADGLDGEPRESKSQVYAISSAFAPGFARLTQFFDLLRQVVGSSATQLVAGIDASLAFLESHQDRYLLLETLELDCMSANGADELRRAVEAEINECRRAGIAVDALTQNPRDAAQRLREATRQKMNFPLGALYGLRLDDDCDNLRLGLTEYPLGLEWSDELCVNLQNRSQFDAGR